MAASADADSAAAPLPSPLFWRTLGTLAALAAAALSLHAASVLLTPFTGDGALLVGLILALVAIKLVVLSGPPRPH